MLFCPFCGSKAVEIRQMTKLWWCIDCRKTWIISYFRQLKAAPEKKGASHGKGRYDTIDGKGEAEA